MGIVLATARKLTPQANREYLLYAGSSIDPTREVLEVEWSHWELPAAYDGHFERVLHHCEVRSSRHKQAKVPLSRAEQKL